MPDVEGLLMLARQGDEAALGRLLDRYRSYLRVLARSLLGSAVRLQLEPSDLVQETLLDAARDLPRFAGTTEANLMSWLRKILVRNLADQARHGHAEVRDRRRQESLEALLERSSVVLHQALSVTLSSPSHRLEREEEAARLADALESLPPDYEAVIRLRNIEHLPFEEIAARLGRSSAAVRMLWVRALERLQRELGGRP